MRRFRGLLPGLLLGLLAGCATDQSVRPAGWLDRVRSGQAPLASDGVLLDISLIEKPIQDVEINQIVWDSTDEQIVGLEHKWKIEENGFRVGHVIGMTPDRLQALLGNDRYCVWRKRQILAANKPLTLDISRIVEEFRFQIREDGQPAVVALEHAQAYLVVVPSLTSDGRTTLQFTPEVQYGEKLPEYQVAADRSGWLLTYKRRSKTYPALSWSVTVAPNEYLVLGANFENPRALGYRSFVQEDERAVAQRLLVIRTSRSLASNDEPAENSQESVAHSSPAVPLALQASWTTARGCHP